VLLSVVIPSYNEGTGVVTALERTIAALHDSSIDFEVVFMDDASTDDTLEVAEAIAAHHPEVRIIRNERNLGCTGALLRGFSAARGEFVTFNGTDLPFAPEDTAAMLEPMQSGADVVVVQRRNRQAYKLRRKVVSLANISVLRVLLRSPFSDHNFVQCYRRTVLEDIEVSTRGVGTVTPELILKARRLGFKVVSITCEYHERQHGRSSITVADVVRSTVELPRLWAAVRRVPKPNPTSA
jgi:dolichol-phosphate mannosyltransferase